MAPLQELWFIEPPEPPVSTPLQGSDGCLRFNTVELPTAVPVVMTYDCRLWNVGMTADIIVKSEEEFNQLFPQSSGK